uniref:Uncharacterized protein n=1 Tax=Physcomitrium patens TaxID=3218 RepID=A0A2K1IWS2_PHYPA|nr:hypothetical protein PHYPA_023537 [Physcomitrium patens]
MMEQQQQYTTRPLSLHQTSQSVPETPTKIWRQWDQKERWEVEENEDGELEVQQMESWQIWGQEHMGD